MTTFTIPKFSDDIVTLRAPTSQDFESYAAILASPRSKYLNGPYDRRAAWKDYCLSVAEWVLHGVGPWTVEFQGRFAGLAGLSVHPDFPEPEMGWVMSSDFEGKGLAYAAGMLLRDVAFRVYKLPTLVSYMMRGNHRAEALAERLGGVPDAQAMRPWPHALVYRYTSPVDLAGLEQLSKGGQDG